MRFHLLHILKYIDAIIILLRIAWENVLSSIFYLCIIYPTFIFHHDFQHCEVQLIDFGITEKIPISTLRHLPNQFVTASAHVTGCYIANIQPAGGKKWSSTAQDLFSVSMNRFSRKCLTFDTGCDINKGLHRSAISPLQS